VVFLARFPAIRLYSACQSR